MSLARGLTTPMIMRDAAAYLDFLAGLPQTSGPAVGTTGYCLGGRISLIVAAYHPDRVAAAASFHGGRLAVADDADSPHLLAGRIRVVEVPGRLMTVGRGDSPRFAVALRRRRRLLSGPIQLGYVVLAVVVAVLTTHLRSGPVISAAAAQPETRCSRSPGG